jgi:hypothetical protein
MLKEPVEKRKQGIMEGGNWRGLAGAGRLYFKKRYLDYYQSKHEEKLLQRLSTCINCIRKVFISHLCLFRMSVTSKLMEELRKDEKLEDEFMTFIAERVALKPSIRGVILSAVLREVATKEDIEKLRDETREEIEKLREEMNTRFSSMDQRVSSLEQRMSKIEGQLSLLIRIFIAFNLPILIGIIGILLRSYVP